MLQCSRSPDPVKTDNSCNSCKRLQHAPAGDHRPTDKMAAPLHPKPEAVPDCDLGSPANHSLDAAAIGGRYATLVE